MINSLLFYVLLLLHNPLTQVTLEDALSKKMVEVSVVSNPKGTHYLLPIMIQLKNVTDAPIDVLVENGRTFAPVDTTLQPILIIKEELISLSPGQTKWAVLTGMCFNMHKHAPASTVKAYYNVKPINKGKLGKLSKFLQDNKYFGIGAQEAIWCISNDLDLESIIDWDDNHVANLVKYVAELTGKPVPNPASPDDYRRNIRLPPREEVQVGGNFEYTILKPTEIHIAMFDEHGIVVRELYYNSSQPKGVYSFDYLFDATVYKDPVYYIRQLENREVIMEFRLDM